jgi:hypothetical protein
MIYTASPLTRDEQPPTLEIIANVSIDAAMNRSDPLPEWAAFYQAQGKELADALCNALPGGTLDQLLAELLRRKASHFAVATWATKP